MTIVNHPSPLPIFPKSRGAPNRQFQWVEFRSEQELGPWFICGSQKKNQGLKSRTGNKSFSSIFVVQSLTIWRKKTCTSQRWTLNTKNTTFSIGRGVCFLHSTQKWHLPSCYRPKKKMKAPCNFFQRVFSHGDTSPPITATNLHYQETKKKTPAAKMDFIYCPWKPRFGAVFFDENEEKRRILNGHH